MFNSMFDGPEEAFRYLEEYSNASGVRSLCSIVLDDPRFKLWSGSSKPNQHHYGDHGLLIHTAEVVKLCLKNNDLYYTTPNKINERKLFLSALFHDAGKMWDYKKENWTNEPWIGTPHKRHIHHISRSNMVWCEAAIANKIDEETKDDVSHAILAHHGLREWGSPVMPSTRLAWMLHFCDCISARMNDADKWDHTK